MPTTYTNRVLLIVAVLLGALWLIFPSPRALFNPNIPFSQKTNLRPGIDMVGGTSLLYEIKVPPGATNTEHLSEQVMDSLKKRVDPQGVQNLIWRPQGPTRLEIQMPTGAHTEKAKAAREAFDAATQKLAATNIRSTQVLNAVEKMTGAERDKRLKELAMDSPRRAALFSQMASVWDQIQDAHSKKDAAREASQEVEYDKLKGQLDDTVLKPEEFESQLDDALADSAKYKAVVDRDNAVDPSFASRIQAVNEFATAFKSYSEVRGSIDDAAALKRQLKGSGVLEFHILVQDRSLPDVPLMIDRLTKSGPRQAGGDTMKWVQIDRDDALKSVDRAIPGKYNGKTYVLVFTTSEKALVNGEGISHWALERAYPAPGEYGETVVGFEFDAQGAKYFSDLTRTNKGMPLGIVLDDKLISAPNINSEIGKSGVITGQRTEEELNYLINTLNAGALPAQLAQEPISEHTVGPQLGADNLRAGLHSCLFGLIVVGVFLACYYYTSGIVAFFAVLMNLVMILGVMAGLNATFTLPGVAGIVLTIGAAVDANVLVFERFREEQQRGLSLRMALRNAYDRAFSAIVDSNMTTVITSLILCWMGSEEVKGFGITLLIGLVSSLFTALFVTKTIFGIMIDHFGVTSLGSLPQTFPKWNRLLHPNIDWLGKVKYFLVISLLFMVAGGWSFYHYRHEMLDIEFASGTSVQFKLKQPIEQETLRERLNKIGPIELPSFSLVAVHNQGEEDKTAWEVVTPNANSAEVKNAIVKEIGPLLTIDVKSDFENVGKKLEDVAGTTVVPITEDMTSVAGISSTKLSDYRGGAAIILKDLNPPLSLSEIKVRLDRMRLQLQSGSAQNRLREYIVETGAEDNQKVGTAVILTVDPDIQYKDDQYRWRQEVAGPVWQLANEAINNPPQLDKVTNFNPQVAGDTQREAIMALTVSLIIILLYIWLRFGNFQFGTATVLAMIHDTFLAVAAIGLAHLVFEYAHPLAAGLMLEPFRLNLTLVAAILTIMSYSMIDTIVVFDRIRENRGKFGHLDRKIINDSINQTLSRTLLTAGTTIVTVAVMYVAGGPGIHGFTFVLLFGILVGTYSSIAIAAPLLLLRRQPGTQAAAPISATRKLQQV